MRILHVVQGYTPAIGGTELVIQKISERLAQNYGDEVTVFTTTAAKNCAVFWLPSEPTLLAGTEQINGVTVRRFPVFNRLGHVRHQLSKFGDWAGLPFRDRLRAVFNGPLIWGMTGEIAQFKADVIGASSFPFLHMHYALAGGKRSNRPVVLAGALHPTDAWGFERPMIYQAIRQANAYIAYTQFERDYLVSRGISAGQIQVIGAGIDPDPFARADGREVRNRYGWGDDPVIVFVGQLNRRKGAHHLLAAMPLVWETFPKAKLLLAGASSLYSEQLAQEAAQLSPAGGKSIIIVPNFPEDQKADIIAAGEVLVNPSGEESFGIVFLEAWAGGKPVIGVRAGAIPSLVSDGEDGLLVAPDSPAELARAICDLLANPTRRAEMGEAGYTKMSQHYTWDIVADKFRKVYTRATTNNFASKP